jgi:hypothetical protein
MIPFPRLPEWLPLESEQRPVALREFGSDMADLAVRFDGIARAPLVTSLLARCSQTRRGKEPAERAIWGLPLGTRIEAIVALAAGERAQPLVWRVRCRFEDCAAEGELELRPSEIAALAAEGYQQKLMSAQVGTRVVWLRRPTGEDQCRWLDAEPDLAQMAATLLVDPSFDELRGAGVTLEEVGQVIDAVMQECDPLVGFRLEVACAECRRPTLHTPDLLAAALGRLWAAQFDLIGQVHRLASNYHWTEEDIGRLPPWRRQAYLAYIGGEL